MKLENNLAKSAMNRLGYDKKRAAMGKVDEVQKLTRMIEFDDAYFLPVHLSD